MSTAKKKVAIKPPTVNSKITSLKFYKTNEQAQLPVFATKQSACFDMYANLVSDENVQYYGAIQTKELPRRVSFDINSNRNFIQLNNMERMLIPTGLIADIPDGFSVRLHSRSGLAFKQGVYLANCEGIIDSDYVDPIYAMVTSISSVPTRIYDGDRICQAELVKKVYHGLTELKKPPVQKTGREGGFGSTGK